MSEELSVEQAVGLLSTSEAEAAPIEAAPPEQEEQHEIEAQPEADFADEPETVAEGDAEPEPETVVEAPHFWSAERKADFAKLPAELQQYVLDNDKQAQRTVSQKLEEAANQKKAAEAHARTLEALTERIGHAAERAETTFASRWGEMTPDAWVRLSQENPQQYIQLKAKHDADQDALQRTRSAKDAAEQVQFSQWVQEQETTLKTRVPELSDPVKGPANKQAVAEYLMSKGVAEQALTRIGAVEAEIAWKALQYERGLAGLKTRTPPTQPAVRPSAHPAKQTSATETLNRRLSQTHSVEDAVALMQARRKTG